YGSAPGGATTDTSWVWKTTNSGKTWKWVPGAAPGGGKVQATPTNCAGGGDTELAVDSNHHLYFNDLTLANFSTGRSDDGGRTFICSNTGVPDAGVDRQWYAVMGDPTLNNGLDNTNNMILLANDEIATGQPLCSFDINNA